MMHNTPDVSTRRQTMTDSYREVSTARQALRDSYQNLQNVADYCEKNYMEATDKRKALENTKSLVTQTVASVACQVEIAARHVSDMLEKQTQILQQEEAKVQFISQLLDIHVEKVSRQKIGRMTTVKRYLHTEKILCSEEKEPVASYTRIPINFTSLDNTGHGITDSDSQLSKTGTMSRKISVKSMSQMHSSLGRSCRIKDPVAAPLIPEKFPNPPSLDGPFPNLSDLPKINGDLPLPPPPALPEYSATPAHETHWPLETGPQFPICKSPENIDDSLPPPPAPDYNIMNTLWPKENGPQSPVYTYTQNNDFLPPPPAPEDEITDTCWLTENAPDFFMCPTLLDDLPPPPDC